MAAPGGPAKFSLALGSKKGAPPAQKKRPHSALHDSDDEDTSPQAQEVSHFDQAAGGAIDTKKPKQEKGPLVIAKLENRDWRAESQHKRQKNLLPPEAQAAQAAAQNGGSKDENIPEEEKPTYGLNVVRKREQPDTTAADSEAAPASDEVAPAPEEPKTEDQLALEALLGRKQKSDLVLPAIESEEEAFRRDYDNAPEMATLEQYEAVPVEEFGAALLRGMGWKEGQAIGRRKGLKAVQPRILEKRPALLGIGAKEDAAIGEELGAWGKGAKGRRKTEQSYNPVMLRNKNTGEQLTEEELKAKLEDQKGAERDYELAKRDRSPARDSDRHRSEKLSRRNKYDDDYESDRREKDRRKRDRDRGRDEDKYRSSRRDGTSSRDYDSKHRSSRRDRSESDEDRYRRRKRDKDYDNSDRKDRDHKHRDRDRDDYYSKSSSRRDDRDKDRHRNSDRDSRRRRDDY